MKNPDESAGKSENDVSRSRRRNDRRKRNRRNRPQQERANGPDCALCGNPIRDISAAMNDPSGENPVHFDCIVKQLSEKETLGNQEKIVYLGSGNFGVVRILNNRKFEILKKIPYEENPETRSDWRMNMRLDIPEK
ncbi:hypothetical protein [Spirochaeta isovalerica]|uniref:Uncharacterized protein n=1 Tax=Spirochaeta isovalerica TaxID=150 RepID=A0A841R5K9_9SPIO|nr:hypothetical protein [Spirochaeta isovalerica]MBB6479116.1 hypothetical protein [Spirochaeta isovalerica]